MGNMMIQVGWECAAIILISFVVYEILHRRLFRKRMISVKDDCPSCGTHNEEIYPEKLLKKVDVVSLECRVCRRMWDARQKTKMSGCKI